MSIEQITAIIQPPASPREVPNRPDWHSIQTEIGFLLPRDYQDFVEIYGSGLLGNFIRVFNPFSSSEYLALVPSVKRISEIRRNLKQSEGDEEVPYELYPDSPGLVPWGNDENGNTLYWLTTGEPVAWRIVVGEGRGRDWEEFEGPMTTFLAKVFRNEITCKIWPADFRLCQTTLFLSHIDGKITGRGVFVGRRRSFVSSA